MEPAIAEGANTPNGTPPPSEASPSSQQEETKAGTESEVLPFHKHPRWEAMNKENREFKSQIQKFEQENQGNAQLFAFGEFLKTNPQVAKAVFDVIQKMSNGQAEAAADPYGEYDPDVAERFRKLDELTKWKADQDAQSEENAKRNVEEYQAGLDQEFDHRLQKDGFLGEDGTPKNPQVCDLLSMSMKSFLDANAKNPDRPSRAEFDAGYKLIMEVYQSLKSEFSRSALTEAVTDLPPPTGSGRGQPSAGKAVRTEQDRIMDIANSVS